MESGGTFKERIANLVRNARAHELFLDDLEWAVRKEFMLQTFEACGGNQCQAARMMGVHRNTFSRRLQDKGVSLCQQRVEVRSKLRSAKKTLQGVVRVGHVLPESIG